MNLALFFLIAERDIQALKVDALTNDDPWKRKLAVRQMLLVLHGLEINKAAGRRLQEAMDSTGVDESLKLAMNAALGKVHQTQQRARVLIAPLRNKVMAHREIDALRQFELIEEVDLKQALELMGDFYASVDEFARILPKVIADAGSLHGLLSQFRTASSIGGQ